MRKSLIYARLNGIEGSSLGCELLNERRKVPGYSTDSIDPTSRALFLPPLPRLPARRAKDPECLPALGLGYYRAVLLVGILIQPVCWKKSQNVTSLTDEGNTKSGIPERKASEMASRDIR